MPTVAAAAPRRPRRPGAARAFAPLPASFQCTTTTTTGWAAGRRASAGVLDHSRGAAGEQPEIPVPRPCCRWCGPGIVPAQPNISIRTRYQSPRVRNDPAVPDAAPRHAWNRRPRRIGAWHVAPATRLARCRAAASGRRLTPCRYSTTLPLPSPTRCASRTPRVSATSHAQSRVHEQERRKGTRPRRRAKNDRSSTRSSSSGAIRSSSSRKAAARISSTKRRRRSPCSTPICRRRSIRRRSKGRRRRDRRNWRHLREGHGHA